MMCSPQEMIDDAARNGIDLSDPTVREFCKKLRDSQRAGVPIEDLGLDQPSALRRASKLLLQVVGFAAKAAGAFAGMMLIANVIRMVLHPYVFKGEDPAASPSEQWTPSRTLQDITRAVGLVPDADDDEDL